MRYLRKAAHRGLDWHHGRHMSGGTAMWADGAKGHYEIRPDFIDSYGGQQWAVFLGHSKIQDDLSKSSAKSWADDHDSAGSKWLSKPVRAAEARRHRNPISMKKKHHTLLAAVAVLAVGGAGVYAYEKWYAATTISPGAYGVPTPSSGHITFALPSAAKGWASVNLIGNGSASSPAAPTSPTTHLQLTGVVKGAVATIAWTDANGAPAVSIISFT